MTEAGTIFDRVSLESAGVLVALIADRPRLEEAVLARRYREQAVYFDETLAFMAALGAVKRERRFIVRRPRLDEMLAALRVGMPTFYDCVAGIVVQSSTRYGEEMRRALNACRLDDGIGWLRQTDTGGDQYAVRNLLMEADAIRLDNDRGEYRISDWFFGHLVKARYSRGTSPAQLRNIQQQQAQLGLAAEKAVLAYEKRAVGPRDAPEVVHIALSNVGAGFDIASLRRDSETGERRFRMIEVKAVSMDGWRFGFTKNEIDVARENGGHYFLHLVPVKGGKPSVADMEVIRDPARLLEEDGNWQIENGGWNVRRASVNNKCTGGL